MACCRLGRHTAPEFVDTLEDLQADSSDDVARLEPLPGPRVVEPGLGRAESQEEAAAEPYLGTVDWWATHHFLAPFADWCHLAKVELSESGFVAVATEPCPVLVDTRSWCLGLADKLSCAERKVPDSCSMSWADRKEDEWLH
jgi:hypothetical protein